MDKINEGSSSMERLAYPPDPACGIKQQRIILLFVKRELDDDQRNNVQYEEVVDDEEAFVHLGSNVSVAEYYQGRERRPRNDTTSYPSDRQ